MDHLATGSLAEVEAEPQAVLEDAGADSVDDVLASAERTATEPAPAAADDGDLATLFEGQLTTPEPRAGAGGPDRSTTRRSGPDPAGARTATNHAAAGEEPPGSQASPARPAEAPDDVLVELERAVEDDATGSGEQVPTDELAAAVEDDEVAAALSEADDLEEPDDPSDDLPDDVFFA